MVMEKGEICRDYRNSVNKRHQITILADLNLCSKEEIMKILLEGGEELPQIKPKKKKVAKDTEEKEKAQEEPPEEPQEEPEGMPEAVAAVLFKHLETLEEGMKQKRRELIRMEEEYKQIADFIIYRKETEG